MFLHDWTCAEDVKSDFYLSDELDDIMILLVSFDIDSNENIAFVLFVHNGELNEVVGFFCSFCGLFKEWKPEKTNIDSLRHRIRFGNLGRNSFAKELEKNLDKL